jgi:hypothetical protein
VVTSRSISRGRRENTHPRKFDSFLEIQIRAGSGIYGRWCKMDRIKLARKLIALANEIGHSSLKICWKSIGWYDDKNLLLGFDRAARDKVPGGYTVLRWGDDEMSLIPDEIEPHLAEMIPVNLDHASKSVWKKFLLHAKLAGYFQESREDEYRDNKRVK